MTEQPTSPFDITSMWKSYGESLEVWKKNYETFVKSGQSQAENDAVEEQAKPESAASSFDAGLWHWQKSGEELFKSFVQNQVELCEFFRDRWAQYLKLPQQLSDCNSLGELKNLQSAFLQEFANDYIREMEKRAKPLAELIRQAPMHR